MVIWKQTVIQNYYINNLGQVRRIYKNGNKKIIHSYKNKAKQELVSLYNSHGDKKNYLVSRLVFCTFNNLPIIYDKINKNNLICHRDDNPSNNLLENLFIGTQKDNVQDCINKKRFVFLKSQTPWNKGIKTGETKSFQIGLLKRKTNYLNKCLSLCNEYANGNITKKQLSEKYHLSTRTIWERLNRIRKMERENIS